MRRYVVWLVAVVALVAVTIGLLWASSQPAPKLRMDGPAAARVIQLPQPTSATTVPLRIVTPARVAVPAVRDEWFQQTPPEPPPTTTTIPVGIPGDCDSWAPLFAHYGATPDEIAFFVPSILERETGCGRDVLNEATGDSGLCQHAPIHNRAGYFGGRYYGAGGWLMELHNLRTREDLRNPEWVNACITLYRACGAKPWSPPYGCTGVRYP